MIAQTNSRFRIKVNSTETNKDSGFYAIINSGSSALCLPNEEYIVSGMTIAKLNERKIDYELIPKIKKEMTIKTETESDNSDKTKI